MIAGAVGMVKRVRGVIRSANHQRPEGDRMRRHLLLAAALQLAACSSSSQPDQRLPDLRLLDKVTADQPLDAAVDDLRPDLGPLPPDGPPPPKLQKVIFTRTAADGNHDLYVANEDGTGVTPLATTTYDEHFAEVTADGRVFYQRHQTYTNPDIYVVKIDGTGTTPLTSTSKAEVYVKYSPDDDRVVYWNTEDAPVCDKYELMSMKSDGMATATLAATQHRNFFLALYQTRVVPRDGLDLLQA
jgi:hypothetical protein